MPKMARSARIRALAQQRAWDRIGEVEWPVLRTAIPGVSTEDVLRSGIPADPPWRAIRQHTFEELAADLTSLAELYGLNPDLHHHCRAEVIRAKERAKVVSKSPHVSAETRKRKEAMAEAMLVWLDDPALFAPWMELRLQILAPPILLPPLPSSGGPS